MHSSFTVRVDHVNPLDSVVAVLALKGVSQQVVVGDVGHKLEKPMTFFGWKDASKVSTLTPFLFQLNQGPDITPTQICAWQDRKEHVISQFRSFALTLQDVV